MILKTLGAVLVLAVAVFLFLANFSGVESRFKCSGSISPNGEEQPATIFLKLVTYRPWVGLWSDSSGSAWVELPNKTVSYFQHLTTAGDLLRLRGLPGESGGVFSTLSNSFSVDLGSFGVFEGACQGVGADA